MLSYRNEDINLLAFPKLPEQPESLSFTTYSNKKKNSGCFYINGNV